MGGQGACGLTVGDFTADLEGLPPCRAAVCSGEQQRNRHQGRSHWFTVADYRVPFARVSPDEEPERFDPGPILARILEEDLLELGAKGTAEGTVSTPWGGLKAERRGETEVLVSTPTCEITARQVLLNAAVRSLGIDKKGIETSHGTIQEVDVGQRVVVCPLSSDDRLRETPDDVVPSGVPGTQAEAGVAYAVTQESPYVKLLGKVWGDVAEMTALAAAGLNLVVSDGFRPTYPRTRIVARLLGRGDEECEVTVQAEQAGGGPAVERVLVGGDVQPVED